MTLTTADISIQLLMDVSTGLSEIHDRMTALTFAAVHDPTQGPEVRPVLGQLLEVMNRTSCSPAMKLAGALHQQIVTNLGCRQAAAKGLDARHLL